MGGRVTHSANGIPAVVPGGAIDDEFGLAVNVEVWLVVDWTRAAWEVSGSSAKQLPLSSRW